MLMHLFFPLGTAGMAVYQGDFSVLLIARPVFIKFW